MQTHAWLLQSALIAHELLRTQANDDKVHTRATRIPPARKVDRTAHELARRRMVRECEDI